MKAYRIKIKSVVAMSSIISILALLGYMRLVMHTPKHDLKEVLKDYGFIIVPAALIWEAIDRFFWRLGWFRFLFGSILHIPPNIRGRWKGTILINGLNESQDFFLEIHQTMTKMQVYTFSDQGKSKSESQFATITADELGKKFALNYMWQAEAAAIPEKNLPAAIFHGFTMLNIYENPKQLSGTYFTNRLPQQTKGELKLTLVSRKRIGRE